MKKIVAWCSVIALLIVTTLSPMVNVFAAKNASDAKASGQYDELLEVYYWLQEAETCIMKSNSSHIKNSKNLFLAGGDGSAETNKAEAIKYYNLNFTFDTTKLYDGYLEAVGQGSYKNGSVYCNQLGYQPLVNLMIKYDLYYTDKVADLVCGKNDEGGLFKIKLSNDYRGWGNKAGWWPNGWPEPDNYGYIPNSECRSTFDKIRYYATSGSGAQIDSGDKSNPVFYAGFERNGDFNLTNYFKEYTGDLSSVKSGLLTARRYANFVNACKTVQRTKADYDTAKANGAGNYYRIYHNGATEYFTLEEPNRKLYINDSLTDSTSTTCQAVAEALSPGSNEVKAVSDAAKLTDINSCYDTAQDNIEKLKEVQIDVQKIYDTGARLLRGAKALRDELNYNEFRFDFGNGYAELMRAWARPAGGGDDLDYFIQITEDFENVVKEYHYKTNGGALTQDEIEDLNGRIENYEINLEEFKSSVQDAVDNKMNELPKLSLSDVSVYSGGNGYIKNSVDGFYEINTETGVLTCTANNTIERIRGEIMGITGGSIGFTAYEEVTRDENDTDVAGATGTSGSQDGETVCKANAGVLGWILCPIIKAISGIGEHMWNQVEQNHLKIQAREMFVNNTGVKDAFDVVRNISNIAFIILFMFVIFSQLTGVGIDNYGIKRILPRLIMVAILTNLSYYICEAAVDISNIFGAGLNDMLTGFANNIGYGRDSMGALAGGLAIDGILAGGGIAIFLTLNPVTATGAVMGAISVAFAVFGVIVSIVAAMLVLYLIVVIREAAIIIMVVLAPVAIVCYALPNTEKIYKRWFDIFKALLIVYPICGAMVGAGRLAAAVLGQINTQSMAIAAMIVQVIPFFLIPMLLKNSLAALGNIGAKISNAGRSLSRRASGAVTNGIRNSARFKDFEQFQKDKITAERAKKIAEGRLGSKIDALRSKGEDNLSKSEKSRLRRYESRMARANAVLREDDRRSLENQIGSIQSVQDAELAKQRLGIQESTADTLLYGNDDFIAAQEQKGDNSRRDRMAEAEVGVLELDRDLALDRARSRRSTQEYKAYQDQYAGYSRERLAEDAKTAHSWMNQAGGAQRMSALLQALEANGLENEMFKMLDNNDIVHMNGAEMVMQTLSGSKNKVAKAYGKKAIDSATGTRVSYKEFMSGTGSQSMRAYMDSKGADFTSGLDDKALFQIRNMGTSMRTSELVDFASKLTDNDSIKEVDQMIAQKITSGEAFQMNGKQLSNIHESTMLELMNGENGRKALLAASDDLSPELLANTDATVKIRLNALRSANNKPPLGTPQTPPKPQGESFNDGGGI